jgi:hypothetical protein
LGITRWQTGTSTTRGVIGGPPQVGGSIDRLLADDADRMLQDDYFAEL